MFINLEKSITELHDMFLDIAMLIENQVKAIDMKNRQLTPLYPFSIKITCLKEDTTVEEIYL